MRGETDEQFRERMDAKRVERAYFDAIDEDAERSLQPRRPAAMKKLPKP